MFISRFSVRKHNISFLVLLSILIRAQGAGAQEQRDNIRYLHPDHLGGTSIVTDPRGKLDELIDYQSYGAIRFDQQLSGYSEARKYIGQVFDEETGLQYLNARYYDPLHGRFISQDPLYWQLPAEYLLDPQQQNSYSYARNNPINLSDPSGLSSAIAYPTPQGGWKFGQKMGEFNGVSSYYNGIGSAGLSYSCVEFAKRYQSQLFGINAIGRVGDARSMWNMTETINERLAQANSSYQYEKHINGTESSLPESGDMLFWTEGTYGHIMIVTESSFNDTLGKGHVEVIDQNASNQAVRKLDVKKTDKGYTILRNSRSPVAGWLSPEPITKSTPATSNNNQISAPAQQKQSLFQKVWNRTKQFFRRNL